MAARLPGGSSRTAARRFLGGPAQCVGGAVVGETRTSQSACHRPSLWNAWRGPGACAAPGPRRNCFAVCRPYCCPVSCFRRPDLNTVGMRGSRMRDRRPPHCRCSCGTRTHYLSGRSWMARAPPFFPLIDRSPNEYCGTAHGGPLITAGRPVRPSVPSPSCDNPGFGTPPPHRPAYCCPAVHFCRALRDLFFDRNHNRPAIQCLLQPS